MAGNLFQSVGSEVNLFVSERESLSIVKNVRLFVSVRVLRGQMGDRSPSNGFLDMFFGSCLVMANFLVRCRLKGLVKRLKKMSFLF